MKFKKIHLSPLSKEIQEVKLPVSPISPYRVMKTLASVPANSLSPV